MNYATNQAMTTRQINFAYKVRHALNEQVDALPASTLKRLEAGRKLAVTRKRKDLPASVLICRRVVAGHDSTFFEQPLSWLGRLGVVTPLLLGAALFVGIYQSAQTQHINDIAEIDAAVLADELPLGAYLDHGFNAYLAKRAE